MAAVLADASRRDGRMILGRERDEPRVILVLVWRILAFFFLALASAFVSNDLRRAGFAAYDDVIEFGLVRGATGAVDDVGHRVLHVLQRLGIDLDSVLYDRRIRLGDVTVESLDVLYELRLIADAAVGNLRRDLRHLERSGCDIALADGDRERFGGIPSLVVTLLLPCGRRDGAGIFVIEIDAALDAEAHLVGPLCDSIDAEFCSDVVKINVARPPDRIV